MRAAAALQGLAILMSGAACGQRLEARHPGLAEFQRICLDRRTADFSLAAEDAERLGFIKEANTSRISDEDAARFNIPEEKSTSIATHPFVPHGEAPDPDAYSVWSREERTRDVVQRVGVGHGLFGAPGFSAPSTFCSVLTLSDPEKAWVGFAKAFPGSLYIGEGEGMFLGRMRYWGIELSWAPELAAIVTISDFQPSALKGASGPTIALFTIEVLDADDFERLWDGLKSRANPI